MVMTQEPNYLFSNLLQFFLIFLVIIGFSQASIRVMQDPTIGCLDTDLDVVFVFSSLTQSCSYAHYKKHRFDIFHSTYSCTVIEILYLFPNNIQELT